MRVKDLTSRNAFNHDDFVQFMKENKLEYDLNITGYNIPDEKAGEYKKRYLEFCDRRKRQIISERQRCLLTTASYLDYYDIKEYYGLVTGLAFFSTNYFGKQATQFIGTGGDARASDLSYIQRAYTDAVEQAFQNMKKQALYLGANAVISIQQDTVDAGGVVCITVRGTAVNAEKSESSRNPGKVENTDAPARSKSIDSGSTSVLAAMRPRDELHETNPYIDRELCIGCERCTEICPELFQMKDGKAIALSDMTVETWVKGNEAIDNCPVAAIKEQ